MSKLTYIEARDKIWNAYFRDEIQPYENLFCFCGTLAPDAYWRWHDDRKPDEYDTCVLEKDHPYIVSEYLRMEKALLRTLLDSLGLKDCDIFNVVDDEGNSINDEIIVRMDGYEQALFAGMLAALEVLKNIHRERGDFIPEDAPLLTKRILAGKEK